MSFQINAHPRGPGDQFVSPLLIDLPGMNLRPEINHPVWLFVSRGTQKVTPRRDATLL